MSAIFYELSDNVYKRYKKSTLGQVAGTRIDPKDLGRRVPFILRTTEENTKWDQDNEENLTAVGIQNFDYDTEVIEIYSEKEDALFKRANTYLFNAGLLVPYEGTREDVEENNALSDTEVYNIAQEKNIASFRKRLQSITSHHTLDRIEEQLIELDRKPSFVKELDAYRVSLP